MNDEELERKISALQAALGCASLASSAALA